MTRGLTQCHDTAPVHTITQRVGRNTVDCSAVCCVSVSYTVFGMDCAIQDPVRNARVVNDDHTIERNRRL
jgi:hypothetical protein